MVTFGLLVVLVGLHVRAPELRRLERWPEASFGSFAGGCAAAYVFLHLLPELSDGSIEIARLFGDTTTELTDVFHLVLFLVALFGFVGFYTVETLAIRSHPEPASTYRLHLGVYAVYNVLIGYTLPHRADVSALTGLLFAAAMGLHFMLTDRALTERYQHRFDRTGHVVLVAALVVGYGISESSAADHEAAVTVVTAALAGSVLWNVFRQEVPGGVRSNLEWFVIGVVGYAALLIALTVTLPGAEPPQIGFPALAVAGWAL